jgi:probable F420-dependent oxidoreductase
MLADRLPTVPDLANRPARERLTDGTVLVGVTAPFFDHHTDLEVMARLAQRVDERGYDSFWVSDHVLGPTPMGAQRWYDVITVLAHLAAVAPRPLLGTDVLVVPYRHPVPTGKALMTLDVIAKGRLVVGAGGGYLPHEFAAVGVPFEARGAYTDEAIALWKAMWADGPLRHHGRFVQIDDALAEPKPLQPQGPPVLVGNAAAPVLRRAATVADGWHPIMLPMAALADGVATVRKGWAEAGRPGAPIFSYSGIFGHVTEQPVDGADRPLLVGSPAQVLDDIAGLAAIGFSSVVFRFGTADSTNAEVLDQVDLVAEQVLPHTRSLRVGS